MLGGGVEEEGEICWGGGGGGVEEEGENVGGLRRRERMLRG